MSVTITDVVLRDGLQDEDVVVSTDHKIAVADALVAAGVKHIEAASFVSPTRVPQMADADDVIARLPRTDPSVTYSALALNPRGVHRAIATGIDEIQVVTSASAGHSTANTGRNPDEALHGLAEALQKYPDRSFLGGVSTAFVCPFEGIIAPSALVRVASAMAAMGVRRLGLADTLGTATTEQVLASAGAVRDALPDIELSLHLHNAHGQALGTVIAAHRQLGITHFDSAIGGYGGCPFAPGAHGNLATEELVAHLHAHDIDTGIDQQALGLAVDTVKHALAQARPLTAV
ncbi:hydroxymethylglutaryl-CoA lyase [Rhodococcus sp. JS3073]|uniref:hydroxymethylglutaryl-CoA lyase n=1 Tax=Rhodococcus sp. JS3073 TaxID=3002901 RepID=UPI0022859BCA|nr:hydroxymethylglutaryl-CoA lyase [Rhodococcus sp. JS3073]WAM17160.1 hydroxymethylglutaryl-CoA lyase [Rhodococcus sp. JS3073]